MLQLTYISTATSVVTASDIAAILATSRRNNAAAQVTGLLLYDGHRFLQALEGPADAVNATYARVRADPRHRAVVLLSTREVTERAFGTWAMAAEQTAAADGTTLMAQIDALTAAMTDRSAQALFRGFARVRQAA